MMEGGMLAHPGAMAAGLPPCLTMLGGAVDQEAGAEVPKGIESFGST